MSSSSNSLAGIANVIIFLIISVFVILYSLRYLYLWCLRRRMIRRRNNQLIIAIEASQLSSLDLPKNGLDPSVIAALPTFVYKKPEEEIDGTDTDTGTGTGTDTSIGTTECSICLSTMEEEELVRLLPNCLHLFHAECIDMWLNSHTTCPICRAAVAPPEPEQEPDEAQTDGTGDEVAPPTSPPLEPLNSMTTSSEGASDETAESSKVVDASSSRPIYFHKILSWNRSGRRIQHLEISADGVEDLEKQ